MKKIIEVKNVSKKYTLGERQPYYSFRDTISGILKTPFRSQKLRKDEFWALKDISFDINEGDVVGIIGRNGAGKSTLLKILSQITPPTEGEIILKGRVASLLEVGTGFHPELTGRENIYLNGAILGMKRWEINNKFKEIVDFAEIEKFIDTPVKHYSSGMYMRLAFSVAAHLEPEILLVDEVLSVGDAQFQKKSINKMSEVSHQGRTVLFVSHNLDSISNFCNKTILLDFGRVAHIGETSTVIAKYLKESDSTHKNIFENRNNLYSNNLIIKGLIMESSYGDNTNVVDMGEKAIFRVSLSETLYDKNYLTGIIFKTPLGQIITSTNTAMNFTGGKKTGKSACLEIEKVPFTPGKYIVDISISDNKYSRVDYISNALMFEVCEKDYYKSGYIVKSGNGLVFLDGVWSYK